MERAGREWEEGSVQEGSRRHARTRAHTQTHLHVENDFEGELNESVEIEGLVLEQGEPVLDDR